MKVDNSLIEKLEILARLKLDAREKEQLIKDLEKMIGMFGKISEVDTEDVTPLTHMTDSMNVMRADIEEYCLNSDEFLKNAPEHSNHYFTVPKVIE